MTAKEKMTKAIKKAMRTWRALWSAKTEFLKAWKDATPEERRIATEEEIGGDVSHIWFGNDCGRDMFAGLGA